MASLLVVTAGDGSANSYCSRAVADLYHENRLHADTWTDADAEIKDQALLMATRVLDQQFVWAGVRTSPGSQRLEWPRDGLLNDEGDLALTDRRFQNDSRTRRPSLRGCSSTPIRPSRLASRAARSRR